MLLGQPSTGDLGYHPRGVIVRREELRNTNVTDSPTAKSNNGSLAHSDAVHIVVGLCIVIILATLLTFWKYIRMRGVFDFMNHRVYHSPCRPTKGYTPPIVPVVRTASLDSNSSKTTTLVAVEEKQKKDVYLTPLPAVVIVGRDSRRRL
ncbi:hypothetical protein H0H87_002764 [Tephrocybe sp. NHM501043]|nr:hypothetical protein H0H87_002764 [Tephrocybe sp. NHM501043]